MATKQSYGPGTATRSPLRGPETVVADAALKDVVAQVEVNSFIRETDFDAGFDVRTAIQSNALPEHVAGYNAGEASEGACLEVSRILGYILHADNLLW